AGAEMIFCSGQLGIAPDGNVPADVGAQAELCFENISRILRDGGMDLSDVVRINAYVTDRAYMRPYVDVRDWLFPQPGPTSTPLSVCGFTREACKVEIEVVAAR